MKYKKLLKWGLPFLGLTAIAVSLPVTLTACSTTDQILEPKDPNKITPATQNFNNSYKKVEIVTNQQAADADLLSQFSQLSDAQKQRGFSNDLQNYVNSLYTYGEEVFPGMIDNPQFSNYHGQVAKMLTMFKMKNDPNKLDNIDPSYLVRYYLQPEVYDIKWNNGKLNFSFDVHAIVQVKQNDKIIAQVNIVTHSQYTNLTVTPFAVTKDKLDNKNRHYATWVITAGDLVVIQKVNNIITNQNTPFDDYFKANINKTFYTKQELETPNPEEELSIGNFKLLPKSTHTISATADEVIETGLDVYYWDLVFNGDKPTSIKQSSPIIFMAPSLNKVYQFNGTLPPSGENPTNSSNTSR